MTSVVSFLLPLKIQDTSQPNTVTILLHSELEEWTNMVRHTQLTVLFHFSSPPPLQTPQLDGTDGEDGTQHQGQEDDGCQQTESHVQLGSRVGGEIWVVLCAVEGEGNS